MPFHIVYRNLRVIFASNLFSASDHRPMDIRGMSNYLHYNYINDNDDDDEEVCIIFDDKMNTKYKVLTSNEIVNDK